MIRDPKSPSPEEVVLADSEHGESPRRLTLGERLQRYGHRKNLSEEIAFALGNLGDKEATRLAAKMASCGNWLRFRDYYTIEEVRLTGACFCKKHTVCPLCAVRRSAKFLESNLPRLQHLIDTSDTELHPHLVIFTIKSGHDIGERLRHLESSWQKLLRRKSKPSAYPDTMLRYVVGGVVSLEVTYNETEGWHWHLNVLLLSPQKSFTWSAWKAEWREITGDSEVINFSEDSYRLEATLAETVKYITKFQDLTPDQLMEVHRAVQGRRTIRGFGKLHGLKIPSNLTDDVLPSDLPYIEYVCAYMGTAGYTILQALRRAAGEPSEAQPSVHKTPEAKRAFRRKCQGGLIKGA